WLTTIRFVIHPIGHGMAPKIFWEISHKYEDFHLRMPLFLCRHWSGEPAPQEGQEICWVSPENLENYPMPPADVPVIGKIPGFLKKY
ncbi:MAG: NUDIX domain-containing protein, partial [Sphingomonadales bacterium]